MTKQNEMIREFEKCKVSSFFYRFSFERRSLALSIS